MTLSSSIRSLRISKCVTVENHGDAFFIVLGTDAFDVTIAMTPESANKLARFLTVSSAACRESSSSGSSR